jgi:hypothetical protein
MTTKTATPRPAEPREKLPDDLNAAYRVHTLAQMLYARLAAAPPWAPMVQGPCPPALH